jgi:methylmalonyl-CoA mutase
MGLQGMINDLVERCDTDVPAFAKAKLNGELLQNHVPNDCTTLTGLKTVTRALKALCEADKTRRQLSTGNNRELVGQENHP